MISNRNRVKQCVILSGKGGTGKTSLSASLMHLSSYSRQTTFVDADVDAANLALVTKAVVQETHAFSSSQIAHIESYLCSNCGQCFDVCRYEAVQKPTDINDSYQIIDLLCDGCAACVHVCQASAISMIQQQDGEWFHSVSPFGHLFHAELFPAAENTGKLVTIVKQSAKLFAEDHGISLIIVDGPPGIGCPVISASAGADLAVLVAEPGVSGIHDLTRIIQTLEHFKIPIQIVINKADIYPQGTKSIRALAKTSGYPICGEIPFDINIPLAMVMGQPITQFSSESPAAMAINNIWGKVEQVLFTGEKIDD